MLAIMETAALLRLAKEAEAKAAGGSQLSREERVLLLAWLMLGRETRKERGYGQA